MALIKNFEIKTSTGRNKLHNAVTARYTIFGENRHKVIQIETHGSEERKNQGATSQTIQLDETSAKNLFEIIRNEFGLH